MIGRPGAIGLLGLSLAASAAADDQAFAVHGQFTYVEQETGGFNAPYRGAHSLTPNAQAETTDATLYLGARLWPGAEGWINGEFDQGFGLDGTLGVAGFPSGEAYKVGSNQPYFRLQRAFVRQTFDLSGNPQEVQAAANQLRTSHSDNRVVLTVGKFSVVDVFDTNKFAHDARADFLNWTVIDTGTFDYAADAWGYTVGAAVEWYVNDWTLRAGLFDLSDVPNSVHLEPGLHEYQTNLELEHRHQFMDKPGRVLVTAYQSRGQMGLLDEAVALAVGEYQHAGGYCGCAPLSNSQRHQLQRGTGDYGEPWRFHPRRRGRRKCRGIRIHRRRSDFRRGAVIAGIALASRGRHHRAGGGQQRHFRLAQKLP